MIITKMTFHAELVDRGGVVHPDLLLLCIVAHPHTNVIVAPFTPDVVRHLKSYDENPQVQLPGPLSQSMSS